MTIAFLLNQTRKITLLSDIQDVWENESQYVAGDIYYSCDCEDEKGEDARLNMSPALKGEFDDLHLRLIQEGKKGINKGSVLEITKRQTKGESFAPDLIAWEIHKIN